MFLRVHWISDPSGTICDIIAAEQHVRSLSKPPLAQIYVNWNTVSS